MKPDRAAASLAALTSGGVLLFFGLTLSVPSGYSYGGALLLAAGLWFLAGRPRLSLTREDKLLAVLLGGIFVVSVATTLWHGNTADAVDGPSRFFLAIPVLFLLLHRPPRLQWLWAGVVVGSLSAAGLGLWQQLVRGTDRIHGHTNAIQFGDIAFVLMVMSLSGLFWAGTQGRHARRWRLALNAAALAGLYCVAASGTRGAWVALATVVPVFACALLSRAEMRRILVSVAVLVAALAVYCTLAPHSTLTQSYSRIVSDIQKYERGNVGTSVGARLEMWRAAGMSIAKRPLLGWGVDEYRAERQRLAKAGEIDRYVLQFSHAHNSYLDIWVFQGVAGLLLLLALHVVPFVAFCRRLRAPDLAVRAVALGGASLVGAFFMFSMTQAVFKHNNGVMFFVIALVVFWACMRRAECEAASLPPCAGRVAG